TNAFGDPTRRAIYLMAREQEVGVTATEAAERFDLHPNVARHHLDKLAAGGYLDVSVAPGHPGAGRPSKRYKASAKDTGLDFGATATARPVVCAVDRGMVRGMLAGLYGDTVPATEASRPQGDDVCVTVV